VCLVLQNLTEEGEKINIQKPDRNTFPTILAMAAEVCKSRSVSKEGKLVRSDHTCNFSILNDAQSVMK